MRQSAIGFLCFWIMGEFGTLGWNSHEMLEVELISHCNINLKVENAERILDSRKLACETSVGNQKICQKQDTHVMFWQRI